MVKKIAARNNLDRNLFNQNGFLILTIVLLSTCVTSVTQNELEPFARHDDYNYFLSSLQAANLHIVSLDSTGFIWPSGINNGDSALLEFHLDGTRGNNPAIRVSFGAESFVQYFEEGGVGIRYLDLTPLINSKISGGQYVSFASEGAGWAIGERTLAVFNNEINLDSKILVIAPHPDDAEIAAYGLYQAGQADVVTITAGDAGGANFKSVWSNPGEQYRAKGRIRTIDSLTVPLLGGLKSEQIRNLGYYDSTLQQLYQQSPRTVPAPLATLENPAYFRQFNFDQELRERPFESNWPSLVGDLYAELENLEPEIIISPHPLLDRHADHQYASIALFEALQRWGRQVKVLLYTNHAMGNEAFPLGLRDGMMGLPPWNEDNLYINSIYSYQLDSEAQGQKLIALEAMHDLRPFDPRDGSDVDSVSPLLDYFRRAPRPNEIFLVTNLSGVGLIISEFFQTDILR